MHSILRKGRNWRLNNLMEAKALEMSSVIAPIKISKTFPLFITGKFCQADSFLKFSTVPRKPEFVTPLQPLEGRKLIIWSTWSEYATAVTHDEIRWWLAKKERKKRWWLAKKRRRRKKDDDWQKRRRKQRWWLEKKKKKTKMMIGSLGRWQKSNWSRRLISFESPALLPGWTFPPGTVIVNLASSLQTGFVWGIARRGAVEAGGQREEPSRRQWPGRQHRRVWE